MLLSIGMIVKNEEKNLRKCLEGLKPILDNVRSELIIHDTGSTDATVEIAKEFTDKVYEIEWREDFAWARNHGISKAIGRWFMFVDADEVFVDTAEIIDFFNSGEYQNFKAASYNLRNLLADGKTSHFRATRLFKREKETRFQGKIHEYIVAKSPLKAFQNAIANHTGYFYKDAEFRATKHERNLKPLLEEYEKNKTARTIVLLINEYLVGENLEKAGELTKEGRKMVGNNQKDPYYHVFATKWADYLADMEMFDEFLEHMQEYFSNLTVFQQNAVTMCAAWAAAFQRQKRYKEAGDTYVKSLDLFERNKKGEIRTDVGAIITLPNGALENRSLHIIGAITTYLLAGEFDLAWEYYGKIEGSKVNVFTIHVIHSLSPEGNKENIAKLYNYALSCGIESERYFYIVDAIEKSIRNFEEKVELARVISESEELASYKDDDYLRLQRLRLDDFSGLDYFLSADKPFKQHYGDVLLVAAQQKRDFSGFLNNLRITDSNDFAGKLVRTNKGVADVLLGLDLGDKFSVKLARVMALIANTVLGAEQKKTRDDEFLAKLFEIAMRIRHKYLSAVYATSIYCDEGAVELSELDACTFFSGRAYEFKDKGDTGNFIKNLRLALQVNPQMKDLIAAVVKLEEAKMPAVSSAAEQINQQMAQQAAGLKGIINAIIATGDLQGAAGILETYAALNPSDPEIGALKQKIGI